MGNVGPTTPLISLKQNCGFSGTNIVGIRNSGTINVDNNVADCAIGLIGDNAVGINARRKRLSKAGNRNLVNVGNGNGSAAVGGARANIVGICTSGS